MKTRMRPLLLTAGLVATIAPPTALGIARAVGAAVPGAPLSADEIAALRFAREEEKLARDLSRAFAAGFRSRVFSNIALAEQRHMDAMLTLLHTYGIADPVGDNPVGAFADRRLQAIYDDCLERGTASLPDALLTGAYIEELDLHDLERSPLAGTDRSDIAQSLANLHGGSENHLRAFVDAWQRRSGDVYTAQILDTAEVARILAE